MEEKKQIISQERKFLAAINPERISETYVWTPGFYMIYSSFGDIGEIEGLYNKNFNWNVNFPIREAWEFEVRILKNAVLKKFGVEL